MYEITVNLPPKKSGMIAQKLMIKVGEGVKHLYGQEPGTGLPGLEKTKKEIPGDFTIVVFPLVRFSRKSPETTAREIGEYLLETMPEIASFNVIKGFLNLVLKDDFWLEFLNQVRRQKNFGCLKARNEDPIIVEYSSPNTNKPLHLGHIRNNLLGHSLSEILKANGHRVIRVNLVNDRGIHICKSMLAYMKWGNGETPLSAGMKGDHLIGKYYVLFNQYFKTEVHDLMEKGLTEEEAEKQAPLIREAQEILRKWEAKDPETRDLWKKMNDWVYEGFDETYRNLGISFDKTYYESNTYLLGKELVQKGLDDEILKEKEDGSVWADLREEGLDEKLLLRSDGTSVYMTQDLGTAQSRYEAFHPSSMIYVVGNEQNYHFDVLRLILKKLGKNYADHVFHCSYGMVELPEGKMKSREGTVVDADALMVEMYSTAEATTRELGKADEMEPSEAKELFHTIGMGALKYFILKVDPKKNMLFDPRESIDFNGNTGPFIQYTHARIHSLLRRATLTGLDLSSNVTSSLTLLPPEKEILKKLYLFPEAVQQAGDELSPAIIANYVYDLAKGFNQFYQEIPVLKEEDPEKLLLRLALTQLTGQVIRQAMFLLGIEVPTRM